MAKRLGAKAKAVKFGLDNGYVVCVTFPGENKLYRVKGFTPENFITVLVENPNNVYDLMISEYNIDTIIIR